MTSDPATPQRCRVMTYNTHACRGRDRRVSEERISQVIAEVQPDIVALQEIDQKRRRSKLVDQAEEVARSLGMTSCFSPSREWPTGAYGNAILSRHPITVERTGILPRPRGMALVEPRSAQLATIAVGEHRLQILNTHLGLLAFERLRQVLALMGPEWLGHVRHPLVLCGDLNARPMSREIRLLTARFQAATPPDPTFPASYPLVKLDHLFHTRDLAVEHCFVHRTPLARQASDHYPLVADLVLA